MDCEGCNNGGYFKDFKRRFVISPDFGLYAQREKFVVWLRFRVFGWVIAFLFAILCVEMSISGRSLRLFFQKTQPANKVTCTLEFGSYDMAMKATKNALPYIRSGWHSEKIDVKRSA